MTAVLSSTRPARRSAHTWVSSVRAPLAMWAIWRLAHLATFLLVGGAPTLGPHRWDDGYYLRILRVGYAPIAELGPWQQTNFFPLLPWLTNTVQLVVRSEPVAMNLVVTATQVAAILMVWYAARLCTSERVATATVALFLLFPASVHLWFFYSEGLFIALTAGSLYAAERGRMRLAAILGIAVAMTRTIGVLVAIPLAVAVLQRRRRLHRDLWWAVAPVIGLAVVCTAQWVQAGDPFAFMEAAKAWETETTFPLTTIWDRLQHVQRIGYTLNTTLDVVVLAVWLVLAALGLRSQMPWSYKVWCWIGVVAPLVSGLELSWTRYMYSAWPAFIVAAGWFDTLSRPARLTIAVCLAAATFGCIQDWHNGYFIS